jgi:hypothetical protein
MGTHTNFGFGILDVGLGILTLSAFSRQLSTISNFEEFMSILAEDY